MSEKHEGKSVCLSVQMLKDAVNVFLTHCISHRLWWLRRAAPVLSCPVCVPNARSLKQKPLTCVFMGASIQGGHLKLYRHHHHHEIMVSSTLMGERHITLTTKTSTQDTVWIPRNVAN